VIDERSSPVGAPSFHRIIVLTQYYAPESGAPAIRLRAMVRELRRLGIEVHVLTGMPNYPTGRIYPGFVGRLTMKDEIDGVPVRRVWLYAASGGNALARLLNYLSFTLSSGLALAFQPRADLVFVEAQPITLALPALVNRIVRGTPYVYNTPDLQVEYAEEDRWVIRGLIRAARTLEGFLMRRALAVTTVTHAFIEHFSRERAMPRDRLTFLPNGADTDRLRPMPRNSALAARLGVGDRRVFTFAGTHARYQGLEVILQAARLLRHRRDLVILMVGDGPVRRQLVERAQREGLDNVLFGVSPFDEMPELMSITWCALVVLRRLEIATKMRLSKAIPPLACGVPIIYAGWGETADIVSREGVGICVEPERAGELARAMEQMADDRELRDVMGKRGRLLAERDFSWSLLVENWLRQVERIMSVERIDGKYGVVVHPDNPPPAGAE
jgi:glycosyltransferase involved in cell wall biosynthesis